MHVFKNVDVGGETVINASSIRNQVSIEGVKFIPSAHESIQVSSVE